MKALPMRSRLILLPLVISVLVPASCAPRPPATAHEAVVRLQERKTEFAGARSHARIRITGPNSQSLRANIAVGSDGVMTLWALTPFGTTAAAARIDGNSVTFVNHLRNLYWEGSLSEISGGHGLTDALRYRGLPFLLVGLPPWEAHEPVRQEMLSPDLIRLTEGDLSVVVSASGIVMSELRRGPDTISMSLDQPSLPPTRVVLTSTLDPARTIVIEHLDLTFRSIEVEPVRIPATYRRVSSWEDAVRG
jgi:hypothetical protein